MNLFAHLKLYRFGHDFIGPRPPGPGTQVEHQSGPGLSINVFSSKNRSSLKQIWVDAPRAGMVSSILQTSFDVSSTHRFAAFSCRLTAFSHIRHPPDLVPKSPPKKFLCTSNPISPQYCIGACSAFLHPSIAPAPQPGSCAVRFAAGRPSPQRVGLVSNGWNHGRLGGPENVHG